MKKLLALLLALLMIFSMTALAEDASLTAPQAAEDAAIDAPDSSEENPEEAVEAGPSLSELAAVLPPAMVARTQNVTVAVTSGGRTQTLPLQDFSAVIALDTTQDPQLIAAAYQGNAPLALGMLQLAGDRLYFTMDGLYQTYETEIPALNTLDPDLPAQLIRVALPGLLGLQLPAFGAITIPKMDFTPIFKPYIVETTEQDDATVARFEISEDQMTQLIAQLSASLQASGQGGDMNAVIAALDDYKSSELILSAKGAITDSGNSQTAEFDLMVTSEGEIADTPTAVLKAETTLNDCRLTLSLPSETDLYDLAQARLFSDAQTDSTSLSFEALHALSGNLNLNREEGGIASIEWVYQADFLNQLTDVNIIYGKTGDMGFLSVVGRNAGTGSFEFTASGMPESDTAYAGEFSYSASRGGVTTVISGQYRQALGAMDVSYEMPADIVPIDRLDIGAIGSALTPLGDYFAQRTTPPTQEGQQ